MTEQRDSSSSEPRTDPVDALHDRRPIDRRRFLETAAVVGSVAVAGVTGSAARAATRKTRVRSASKRTTLRIWDAYPTNYGNALVMQKQVWQRFQKKHPNLKLEYTGGLDPTEIARKFIQADQVGQAPDLFYNYASKGELWLGGYLHPLDDVIDQARLRHDFYPGALEIWTLRGKLYGLPTWYGTKTYVYRKDVLEKAGVKLGAPPTTWNAFADLVGRAAIRKKNGQFVQDGYSYYATSDKAASSERLVIHILQNGGSEFVGDPVTGKSGLRSPEAIEAFSWFMDLIRVHQCESKNGPVAPSQASELGAGLAAVDYMGPWTLPKLEKAYPGTLKKLVIGPNLKEKVRVGLGNANAWSVNTKSDLLDETLDLLRVFLQSDLYKAYDNATGDTSARRSINRAHDFWMAKYPQLKTGAMAQAFEQGVDVDNWHVGYGQIYSQVYGDLIEGGLNRRGSDKELMLKAADSIDAITKQAIHDLKK